MAGEKQPGNQLAHPITDSPEKQSFRSWLSYVVGDKPDELEKSVDQGVTTYETLEKKVLLPQKSTKTETNQNSIEKAVINDSYYAEIALGALTKISRASSDGGFMRKNGSLQGSSFDTYKKPTGLTKKIEELARGAEADLRLACSSRKVAEVIFRYLKVERVSEINGMNAYSIFTGPNNESKRAAFRKELSKIE